MAGDRRPWVLVWLVAAVAAGTVAVVAVTLALYPTDRGVSAAVPSATRSPSGLGSAPAGTPSASATATTGVPTDAQGCPSALTSAPDSHLLCPPDLGSAWRLDTVDPVRPVSELCPPALDAAAPVVGSSKVLLMRGPGFDVVEQVRQYGSAAKAIVAFDHVRLRMLTCDSGQTGLSVRDADNEIVPASLSAGYVGAQSWWLVQNRMRTGLVLFQVGTAVLEVAVVPADASSGPPQAALVTVVAQAALERNTQPRTASPSASSKA